MGRFGWAEGRRWAGASTDLLRRRQTTNRRRASSVYLMGLVSRARQAIGDAQSRRARQAAHSEEPLARQAWGSARLGVRHGT